MLKEEIKKLLEQVASELEISPENIVVDYPIDSKHGDYTTNLALVAAKKAGRNPRELAEGIVTKMQKFALFEKVEIAGPGFINMWMTNAKFAEHLDTVQDEKIQLESSATQFSAKKVMVEFAHPNTHKAFHIGHLRNITTGESIVRLLEAVSVKVIRANYQGDVGMHIAKCLYGILQNPEDQVQNTKLTINEKVALLGKAYAQGSKAYEEDENAKKQIGEINKKIYAKDPSIWELYQTTREWSLDYFEEIYKRVYTHFDKYYFESQAYESGKENVLDGLKKGVFVKGEGGAIIFPGSKFGLHDRVFITGEGNPTYEGKDMGLAPLQFKDYNPDVIIHLVGPEQAGYFQVVFEALAQLFPETRGRERHQAYGWVKLKHGKMSSRTGNVVLGEWLLDEAKKKIVETYEVKNDLAEKIAVGAVKYSFLKVGLNQEISFDLEESISLQGNSGPYLQYTFARTQSVLSKSEKAQVKRQTLAEGFQMHPEERDVLRLLTRFPEIVSEAAQRYAPHILCTYLFDLAQVFNLFYQKLPILKAEEQDRVLRLHITHCTGVILKQGLDLLGITAPEKM